MPHFLLNAAPGPVPTWYAAFPSGREIHSLPERLAGTETLWLRLPRNDGQAWLGEARRRACGALVVLSDLPTETEASACLGLGANGYGNTHAAPEVLQQIAGVVAQGGIWVGQDLLRRIMNGAARLLAQQPVSGDAVLPAVLTGREGEVARWVAAGASNREIAERLGITERTVKAHLGAVFEKLQVRDRLQLSLKIKGFFG
jgi:DNA-binding NarL/FixJ family response regulator